MFDAQIVRPKFRQQWATNLKAAANFFKHGRYDDEKTLEFNPDINRYILMASCSGLSRMGETPGMEELAIAYWAFFTTPQYFNDGETLFANPKIKALQNFVPQGPQNFLRAFEDAWNAGYIRR